MKKLAIIGSTGSIGTQVLNVVRRYPDKFEVVALTANSNVDLLIKQAIEFKPKIIAVSNAAFLDELNKAANSFCVMSGQDALPQVIQQCGCDLAVISVVGMCGLKSVIKAIECKIDIALANKESLVAGGELVMNLAKQNGVNIFPIDSEHSAVWQCLSAGRKADLKQIILTASGGAFYNYNAKQLKNITAEQAVKHPTWNMGKKISVDSATMMNKGLELIEARWLFDTLKLSYIIHPQSIIHSMVEYNDGAVIAQISPPNMELPIQLALTYPERFETNLPKWNYGTLTFLPPRDDVFILPKVAMCALEKGGNMPCILNATNEAAVNLFLNNKIGFLDIFELCKNSLNNPNFIFKPTLNDIYCTHNGIYEKLMRDYK